MPPANCELLVACEHCTGRDARSYLATCPRIVFLDVDGVLANWRSQMMTGSGPTADRSLIFLQGDPDEAPPLERSCVEELASLCRDCNATVILSSTWRVDPVLCAFLRRTLEGAGVAVGGALQAAAPGAMALRALGHGHDGRGNATYDAHAGAISSQLLSGRTPTRPVWSV